MPASAPPIESLATARCAHLRTEPAKQDRWRLCCDCGRLVHRSETAHYKRVTR